METLLFDKASATSLQIYSFKVDGETVRMEATTLQEAKFTAAKLWTPLIKKVEVLRLDNNNLRWSPILTLLGAQQ